MVCAACFWHLVTQVEISWNKDFVVKLISAQSFKCEFKYVKKVDKIFKYGKLIPTIMSTTITKEHSELLPYIRQPCRQTQSD